MPNYKYTATLTNTDGVGYETYTTEDVSLSNPITVKATYNPTSKVEVHIYDLYGNRLRSVYDYKGAVQILDSSDGEKTTALYVDPVKDVLNLGYAQGGVKILYNFITPLSSESFFIKELSNDRTELRVRPHDPSFDIQALVSGIQAKLADETLFKDFRLNFLTNDLLIGINIGVLDGDIIIKLYQPLPSQYAEKATFTFAEILSNSIVFEIEAEIIPELPKYVKLRGPNFNLEETQETLPPTEYLSHEQLFNYPVTNNYYKAHTLLSSSQVQLGIDYGNYNEFIHFSSAKERLDNFKYKLGLIETYVSESGVISGITEANPIVTASNTKYDLLVQNIFSKFDEYEKFLYFGSGSASWPKQSGIIYASTSSQGISYYSSQSAVAEDYDNLNPSRLVYTIPEFLREDPNNAPYNLFLDMIGQHFDNLWVYADNITDKFNADNRLDYGVSKDIIADVLKSFGIKLYSSNFSITNLAASFLGEGYVSGSEVINQYISVPDSPLPDKDILSQTYKRIYHNLPYLIKTKGTERGLKALMNCFGIADNTLEIREFGGLLRTQPTQYLLYDTGSDSGLLVQEQEGYIVLNFSPYFGEGSFNQEKIRIDNTGSIASGSVLSRYVSIQTPSDRYTHDGHRLEVSISPTNNINFYLENHLSSSFNIDNYIGDPNYLYSGSYPTLDTFSYDTLSGLDRYNVYDLIRLVKFYDNQLFKMIQDFVPARATTVSGVVIKPHYLDRSKVKSPRVTYQDSSYLSGSIDTAFVTGSDGDAFLSGSTTSHTLQIITPLGIQSLPVTNERPKIDGELSGSYIKVSNGELNRENIYKSKDFKEVQYTTFKFVNPTTEAASIPGPGEISIIVKQDTVTDNGIAPGPTAL